MGKNLLAIARRVGFDNVTQIQNLRRAFRQGNPGEYRAQLELGHSSLDEFISFANLKVADNYVLHPNILRRMFPKTISDRAKTFIDVFFSKSGYKDSLSSSFFTARSITKTGHDVVNTAELRVIKNQAGILMDLNGKGEAGIKPSLNMYISNAETNDFDEKLIIEALSYKEVSSTGKIIVNMPRNGKIRHLHSEIEAPVTVFDTYASIITNGGKKTFKSVIEGLKGLVNPKSAPKKLSS